DVVAGAATRAWETIPRRDAAAFAGAARRVVQGSARRVQQADRRLFQEIAGRTGGAARRGHQAHGPVPWAASGEWGATKQPTDLQQRGRPRHAEAATSRSKHSGRAGPASGVFQAVE